MFVNDDMIVNWWNFAKLNKDRIWNGAKIDQRIAHEMNRRPILNDWTWWPKDYGLKSCERMYKELAGYQNGSSTIPQINVKQFLKNHYRNGNNRTLCFHAWADFAYIPGRLSKEFEMLSRVFFENKVFHEIAFPTIQSMLEDFKFSDEAKGVYLPEIFGYKDFSNVKYVWPKFTKNTMFLHPVKFFGNRGSQNREMFKSRYLPYVKHYTSC